MSWHQRLLFAGFLKGTLTGVSLEVSGGSMQGKQPTALILAQPSLGPQLLFQEADPFQLFLPLSRSPKDLPTWSYCGLSCTFDLGAYCVLKWEPIFKELTLGQLAPRFYSEDELSHASWQVRGCPTGLAVVVGWLPELWGQLSLSCPLKGVNGGKELRLESNMEFPFLLPKAPSGLDLSLSEEVGTTCWDWQDTGIRDTRGMGTLCGPLRIQCPIQPMAGFQRIFGLLHD